MDDKDCILVICKKRMAICNDEKYALTIYFFIRRLQKQLEFKKKVKRSTFLAPPRLFLFSFLFIKLIGLILISKKKNLKVEEKKMVNERSRE